MLIFVHSSPAGQKRASDLPDLEVQMFVGSHKGAGTRTWVLSKNSKYNMETGSILPVSGYYYILRQGFILA